MISKRFNPEKDLAPLPFDERICRRALEMKKGGLAWHQARLVCLQLGIPDENFENRWQRNLTSPSPVEELLDIYGLIVKALEHGSPQL